MTKPLPAPSAFKKNISRENAVHFAVAAAKRVLLFAVGCVLAGSVSWAVNDGQLRFENFLYAQISEPIDKITYSAPKPLGQADFDLEAKAAYSLRINAAGRERTIMEKNINDILPIASLTKLMTATVVIENPDIYSLDKIFTIDSEAAGQDDVPVAGNLESGQAYSVRQLLGAMLYYSSNDAAYALSQIMGTEQFVAAMNQKAVELELGDTGFYNSSGLDIDNGNLNHSTSRDLMILLKYIMQAHPEILSLTANDGSYVTENGIFSINLWDGQKLIGGKTGFTEKAGGCMIYIFENINKARCINIILGSDSSAARVVQMQKLVNYGCNRDESIGNN